MTAPGPTVTGSGLDQIVAEARLLFPFFPASLIQVYAQNWVEHGDPGLALAETRTSPAYESTFPGIRRDDGTLRMTELEYLSTLDGYRQILEDAQINPDLFEDDFVTLIEGEVSPAEYAQRVAEVTDAIDFSLPDTADFLAQQLEVAPDTVQDQRNAILAAALNPDIGNRILSNEISIARLRAEASTRGFQIASPQAQSFLQRGLGRAFFGEAASLLPSLQNLTNRFRRDEFTLEDYAEASTGIAAEQQRIRSLFAQEESQFTRQSGVRFDQGGRLVGLRSR